MLGTFILLMILLSVFFSAYTNHEEFVEVPDFGGFHYSEVGNLVADKDVYYFISDSIYDPDKPRGIVLEQIPKAGALVKPGRKIYLTINSEIPPSVLFPELMDFTVRQAVNKIPTYGLKIESIIYRPAECDNCVIGVLYNGKEIKPGTLIEKGKSITLIVGMGFGSGRIPIPYLYKLTFLEAKELVLANGLNLGFVEYDETVKNKIDSASAFVYFQSPAYDTTNKMYQGQAVDFNLTLDSNKVPEIELLLPDSLTEGADSNAIFLDE